MADFIESSLDFLFQHRWLHFSPVTCIFKDIFENFPDEWQTHLKALTDADVNEIPFLGSGSRDKYPEWPESLHSFFAQTEELSIPRNQISDITPVAISPVMARGMKPKKLHEVGLMARHVHRICMDAKCDTVVDIGSGLGYLDHILHQAFRLRVLGLEVCHSHACAAEKRAGMQGIHCGDVRTVQCSIDDTEESQRHFESVLETHVTPTACCCTRSEGIEETQAANHEEVHGGQNVGHDSKARVCLIGLHCCGDLSTSVMSLFDRSSCVKAMCFVSCCFHKMAVSEGTFQNFPVSQAGQQALRLQEQQNQGPFLSPSSLRLGAQETRSRWRVQSSSDHQDHMRHVAFRGLLEITGEEASSIRKKVRRSCFSSFEAFVDSFLAQGGEEVRRRELWELHGRHKHRFDLIEPFTALQTVVQTVVESLVYKDRLLCLREKGHTSAKIVPIFDETISPRNLALMAIKDNG